MDEMAPLLIGELGEELMKLGKMYVAILEFIYGVKTNWINIGKALGDIYTFSEVYMIMLLR